MSGLSMPSHYSKPPPIAALVPLRSICLCLRKKGVGVGCVVDNELIFIRLTSLHESQQIIEGLKEVLIGMKPGGSSYSLKKNSRFSNYTVLGI